jgi:hypothetical protein
MPFGGRRTSKPNGRRHLLSFPNVILLVFSQWDTCPGVNYWHPLDVSSLSGRAKFEPVSTLLPGGLRFFLHLRPAPPSVCLTVSPARPDTGRRYGISTFRIIDPVRDLGAPWTPAVLRFRVSTLETYTLTACRLH